MLIGAEIQIQHMIDLNQAKIGKGYLHSIQTFKQTKKINLATILTVYSGALNNLKGYLLDKGELCKVVLRKEVRIWEQGNCQILVYKL